MVLMQKLHTSTFDKIGKKHSDVNRHVYEYFFIFFYDIQPYESVNSRFFFSKILVYFLLLSHTADVSWTFG